VSEINHAELIQSLRGVRREFCEESRPILFPTNDHMVRTLAEGWGHLVGSFQISWAACRAHVTALLDKGNLEERCRGQGLWYPRSWYAMTRDEVAALSKDLPYPVVVKPSRPLCSFKAVRLTSAGELNEHVGAHAQSLPVVIQQWIPGEDRQILFGALCLDRGRVLARFEGLKVRSLPRAMGQTTVAAPKRDEAVFETALRFFEGLDLSGAVSLEVKRDEQGRLWVIEPTVGRTDYWVDCCIANGVNLPYVEYLSCAGLDTGRPLQCDTHIWLDTEREPLAYLGLAMQARSLFIEGKWPRFAYLRAEDPMPMLVSLWRLVARIGRTLLARLQRRLRTVPSGA
jgi:predicted ATP-grasp superfamily ATP-dependent carboligase